ncbi:MAG: AI-2E family transporter [Chloroflexota bacterium]|nr:AI-2E family transporter [Chloroflexota bacterium]
MPQKSALRRLSVDGPLLKLEFSTRGIALLLLTLGVIWLLFKLWPVLILLVVSGMLTVALMPFVDWMIRKGLTRGNAVVIVAALLVLVIGLFGLVVVPSVINQGRDVAERMPEIRADAAAFLRERGQHELARQAEQFRFADVVQGDDVVNTSRRAVEILISVLSVIVLTIYMLLDARRIERFFYFMTPDHWHEHVRNLLPALRTTVGGYIRGQALTSGAIAIFTFVVLTVAGVPNALGLAILAGVVDIIPLIGAILAIVPAVLAALIVSTEAAMIVGVALIIYQEFENRILIPKVYGSTLRLPGIAVLVAVLVGAELAGIMGVLLALPGAAAIRVFIMYYSHVREGRVEPIAPEDELLAPDEVDTTAATLGSSAD